MTVFNQIDNQIFSKLFSISLLIYILKYRDENNLSSNLFIVLIVTAIAMSLADAVGWIANGNTAKWAFVFNRWSNFMYFAMCTLPPAAWIIYFDFKILNDINGLKKRIKYYLIPTYIGWILLILNQFYGLIYSFDETNHYIRGSWLIAYLTTNYTLLIIAFILSRKYKKIIDGRVAQTIIIFILLPIIGSILQQFAYGTSLTFPTLNLTVFLAFLILEKDNMQKDPLTGLSTRRQLKARLEYIIKTKEPFTLLMIDLNDFKQINDNYGHDEGDKVLVNVSNILVSNVERLDMVCRYGGDEFMILIESSTLDVGDEIAKRLKNKLEEYNSKMKNPYKISMSIGYKYFQDISVNDLKEAFIELDELMYENKKVAKDIAD